MKTLSILLAALALSGCAMNAPFIEALAKDPASACMSVQTPYGTAMVVRAQRAGVKVTMQAGTCSIEHDPAAGGE